MTHTIDYWVNRYELGITNHYNWRCRCGMAQGQTTTIWIMQAKVTEHLSKHFEVT